MMGRRLCAPVRKLSVKCEFLSFENLETDALILNRQLSYAVDGRLSVHISNIPFTNSLDVDIFKYVSLWAE